LGTNKWNPLAVELDASREYFSREHVVNSSKLVQKREDG
jgi:hypothetical protein